MSQEKYFKNTKFYSGGFKIFYTDGTFKLYKYRDIEKMTFIDDNTLEIIRTVKNNVSGKTERRATYLERRSDPDSDLDWGQKFHDKWEEYLYKSIV